MASRYLIASGEVSKFLEEKMLSQLLRNVGSNEHSIYEVLIDVWVRPFQLNVPGIDISSHQLFYFYMRYFSFVNITESFILVYAFFMLFLVFLDRKIICKLWLKSKIQRYIKASIKYNSKFIEKYIFSHFIEKVFQIQHKII